MIFAPVFTFFFLFFLVAVVKRSLSQREFDLTEEIKSLKVDYEALFKKKEQLTLTEVLLTEQRQKLKQPFFFSHEIPFLLSCSEAMLVVNERLNDYDKDCHAQLFRLNDLLELEKVKAKQGKTFSLSVGGKKLGTLVLYGFKESWIPELNVLAYQLALFCHRIDLYASLDQLSVHDVLTGVYTRRYFFERFHQEVKRSLARSSHLGFLMIDVDFFKKVNDQYGHLTGDAVLREVGSILKASIREIDIAGRFGGEEFCIGLPETNLSGAIGAAERIRAAVEKTTITVQHQTLSISVSVGVALLPTHAKDSRHLIDKADWALYQAKRQGRNRVVVFQESAA